MLSKKKRVTKQLFLDIMKNGKVINDPFFLFRYVKSGNPQYAVVAPKSVAKQAVSRNKLRRQGYYVFNQYTKLPSISGIFFYKKEAKNIDFKDIKKSIYSVLGKINP